jgi:hypothetical protein
MPSKGPGGDKPKSSRFHAVSVKPGQPACEVAISGKTRRWLSKEAPMLPLPGCTQPERCRCTYQHHADRRTGARRAEELDAFTRPVPITNERRKRRGRRENEEN